MSFPPMPRPRERSTEERIADRLSERAVQRRDERLSKEALEESAKRLDLAGAKAQTPELLEREATRLEEACAQRLEILDGKAEGLDVRRCALLPDDLLANPFDLVWVRYWQTVKKGEQSSYDGYCVAAAACDWLADAPELKRAAELREQAWNASHSQDGATAAPHACRRCRLVSGWLNKAGWCDYCLWARQVARDFRSIDAFSHHLTPQQTTFAERYSTAAKQEYGVSRQPRATPFWSGKRRREARELLWVETLFDLIPDTGPATPEKGYQLWLPERFELDAVDGSDVLVHFWATRYVWDGGAYGFIRQNVKLKQASLQVPSTVSAALQPAELADAWYDFRLSIAERNQADWQAHLDTQSKATDQALQHEEHRRLLDSRRGAAAILER